MVKNVALALGLFLFGAFLFTAAGHTYSPDEESIVYVTRSVLTRGDFNIPNPDQYPVVGGHRGVGGRIYSGTGLAPSLLALPLYVVGDQVANAFDPRYHDFILRLILVSLFNSLLTALTGMLFYAWMRACRLSPRVSLALVLVYAFATMAWVYARTIYTEPLLTLCFVIAAYGVRRFADTRADKWMLVAGLACGLAVLAKLQGLLILPALGAYFLLLEMRDRPGWLSMFRRWLWPGVLFVAGLAAGLVILAYYNYIRFGNILESGYGKVPANNPILEGLFGQLLSPGKSVFLYAPPVLLLLLALPRALRRLTAETALCILFIATIVLFHARIEFWSGDGAWGPRYLASTMPFWLLPAGVALGAWWRRPLPRLAVGALVLAGLIVNFLGLAINFDAYLQIQPSANIRYYTPSASPILAQWNLLSERASDWWNEVMANRNGVALLKGFLATGDAEPFPRYLAPRASLLVASDGRRPLQLSLLAFDYRPADQPQRGLSFYSNGTELPSTKLPADDPGYLNYRVQIPAALTSRAPIDIVTSGSKSAGHGPQGDELGVHLQSLQVGADGEDLPLLKYIALPPLPTADPKMQWAWFYEPIHSHFDYYLWYLTFSGLSDGAVLALVIPLTLLALLALAAGAPIVLRVLLPVRVTKPEDSRPFGFSQPRGSHI